MKIQYENAKEKRKTYRNNRKTTKAFIMLESKIQAKIIKKLESENWLCLKLIKTNKNGIPDLVCFKDGETMFIEVKQPNGKLSEIQKYRIDEIKAKGITAKVWASYNTDFQE